MRNSQNGDCILVVSFGGNWDTHTNDQTYSDICCRYITICLVEQEMVGNHGDKMGILIRSNQLIWKPLKTIKVNRNHGSFLKVQNKEPALQKCSRVSSDSSSVAASGTARRVAFMVVLPWGNPRLLYKNRRGWDVLLLPPTHIYLLSLEEIQGKSKNWFTMVYQ